MKKPIVLTAVCIPLLLLLGFTALAVTSKTTDYVFSKDGRTVTATRGPEGAIPAARDAGLTTIAGNLSDYPYGTFFCCFGNTIAAGPPGSFPFQAWVAIPFTPKANVTATRFEVSVGTFGGADAGAFQIQLLADNNNSPGKPIKTFDVLTEPTYGMCCKLDVGNDKTGIPLTGGTQYWVAVTTSSKQTSFAGGWAFNSTDMRSYEIAGWCKGSSTYCGSNSGKWIVGQSGDPLPAYAVLGN